MEEVWIVYEILLYLHPSILGNETMHRNINIVRCDHNHLRNRRWIEIEDIPVTCTCAISGLIY